MATRTSVGTLLSAKQQSGVLSLVPVSPCGHPAQPDSGRALPPPDLPAHTGLRAAASALLWFISFCHYLREKDSKIVGFLPNISFPQGRRGCQPEGAESSRCKEKEKT